MDTGTDRPQRRRSLRGACFAAVLSAIWLSAPRPAVAASASASVTVTVTVEKWVYATCLSACPDTIVYRHHKLIDPCEPVKLSFVLPTFIPTTLLAPDQLTINGSALHLAGAPVYTAVYSGGTPAVLTGTLVTLRFAKADVAALLGCHDGTYQLQLDLPLTSGHQVTACGAIQVDVRP